MFKQILEHARPVMQLSIATFFLVSAGWMVKLYWLEEPIQALGRRLLAKDGALLIKILSDDRTVKTIRQLTKPSGKTPPRLGPLHHLFDRLAAKDGALLKGLSVALLQQPTIQKLLLRAGQPQKGAPQKGPPPLVTLGKYAIDQLLAKDARLANKLALDIIAQVVPKPKPGARKSVPDSWAMIERLGRHALQQLFAKDAALALHVTKEIIASQQHKRSKGSKPPTWDPQALVKGLGEHAIDRLTASRARSLRAILQSVLGAEPMRALRGLRQVIQRLSQQLQRLHVGQLAREAAYQLGRGGLEAFLREQQSNRQREERRQRKLLARDGKARRLLRSKAPCFVPRGEPWLAYRKGAITASLHRLAQRASCQPKQCRQQRRQARAILWDLSRDLVSDPADLVIQLSPSCAYTPKPPTRSKPNARKQPPARRPKTDPRKKPAPPRTRRQIPPKR